MNQFGAQFRLSIFGESHGNGVGIVIDGCPSGIGIRESDFEADLARRRPGAPGTTPRSEKDQIAILSGIYNDKTTGAPIALFFGNSNTKSSDYARFNTIPRPGHADFVAFNKWSGNNDNRGGGHFSGRLTIGLVAAGVIAKKIIDPIDITARILEVGGDTDIEASIARAITNNDSIGGILECRATNLPIGLGEPFFNSLESVISHLVFSIPAVKAIEFGSGFNAAKMTGSVHNDAIIAADGTTATNNAGGINGGISNGNDLIFRIVVKPTSSTPAIQNTYNFATNSVEEFKVDGRHDLCIALRVPPILEAVTAIALADLWLQKNS
ncbi:MAG TPA: chorismate synthase [Bacteroidales bacterium]